MKKIASILLAVTLLSSCVSHKKYLVSNLETKFIENKEKFYESKGLKDKPEYKIEVTYSDKNLSQDYDVIAYSDVNSVKPFYFWYKNIWMNNQRIFQILHYGYCVGLIEHSDGLIIEPDLGAFKYVRYKNSAKPQYIEPEKEKFTKIISLGGGLDAISNSSNGWFNAGNPVYTNFGLSFDRRLDCITTISHGFELGFGLPKETSVSGDRKSVASSNYLRYRLLYKYSISGWLTNTYNVSFKKENALTVNVGPNFDFFNNFISKEYQSDVLRSKRVEKYPNSIGLSWGLDIKMNDRLSMGLGFDSKMLIFGDLRKDFSYDDQGKLIDDDITGEGFQIIPKVNFLEIPIRFNFGLKIKV